jgi:hypothetical protein
MTFIANSNGADQKDKTVTLKHYCNTAHVLLALPAYCVRHERFPAHASFPYYPFISLR